MWDEREHDFDPNWFNHSEECDESRMFFTRVKDQTDKAILFEHPQGYDFWIPKKTQSPIIVEVSTKKVVKC